MINYNKLKGFKNGQLYTAEDIIRVISPDKVDLYMFCTDGLYNPIIWEGDNDDE